ARPRKLRATLAISTSLLNAPLLVVAARVAPLFQIGSVGRQSGAIDHHAGRPVLESVIPAAEAVLTPLLVVAVGVAPLAHHGAVGRHVFAVEEQTRGTVLEPHVAAIRLHRPLLVGAAGMRPLPGSRAVGRRAQTIDIETRGAVLQEVVAGGAAAPVQGASGGIDLERADGIVNRLIAVERYRTPLVVALSIAGAAIAAVEVAPAVTGHDVVIEAVALEHVIRFLPLRPLGNQCRRLDRIVVRAQPRDIGMLPAVGIG